MGLETGYIYTLNPQYNILKIAGHSFGFKHAESTKMFIKDIYTQERRDLIGALNRGKSLSESVRAHMRDKALTVLRKYELNMPMPHLNP